MSHEPGRETPHDRKALLLPHCIGREARRYLIEWLALGCFAILVTVVCIMTHATAGLDRVAYDRLLPFVSRPLVNEIAVVGIDDDSIAAFGRWPWSREQQARVLRAVRAAGAAAIVYDVLLTERADGDAVLADAVRAGPTYLPLLLTHPENGMSGAALLPQGGFARAAAGLGHVDLEADPDGIVRTVALVSGDPLTRRPYIDVPVYQAIRAGTVPLAGGRYVAPNTRELEAALPLEPRVLIPFGSGQGGFGEISCAQLLDGTLTPDALRGKVVFVGVTADGLYGHVVTPISGTIGPLPDVAVHAHALSALLTGSLIRPARAGWTISASLLPAVLLLAGIFVLSPWRTLLLAIGLSACCLLASALLLNQAHIWLSPVPALIALATLYPLWSWRRLEMTMSRLRRELAQLDREPHLLPEPPMPERAFGGDMLERQIALVERAAQRLQDMKRFVWDSLNSVPEPVLVADGQGVVLLANKVARSHFVRLGMPEPCGRGLSAVLGEFSLIKTMDASGDQETDVRARWPAILDPRGPLVGIVKRGLEIRDRTGHDYLLRYARCRNEHGQESGSWVAALVEVTTLHAAERGREDALQLLSHDMRSRHASILALVELERTSTDSDRTRALLERIERHAQRALKLADDFVQLARAESQAYSLEPTNFVDIVSDASDEVWPQAHTKGIRVETHLDEEPYWVYADRSLMTRAIVNVINNAIKYSPNDTVVDVTVKMIAHEPRRVQCIVADRGYGIPLTMQRYLFEPFRRFQAPGQPSSSGAGLGMAFIKAVVVRHGGEVRVDSEPGRGTSVMIALPTHDIATNHG
ncbi:CHASE2 domain-containing protein [Trinickia sp. LjRoot230]|uniref:CHASE2 domain-containing protein n=1 Tax=Trinickia sp. LjRoot230 TaxID=3342288 RepID=UPI003ECE68BC